MRDAAPRASTSRPPPRQQWLLRLRRIVADGCYLLLSLILWLSGIILVALGSLLAFVILAADLQPFLFFAHLDNLATHYLAADPVRRARFDIQLLALFIAIAIFLLLARLPGFVVRMRRELNHGEQS